MTDKEVQKLKRAELLEMLIEQSKEVETLRSELKEANKKLEDRRICLQNAGSIAEASFQLNGIFEAAQAAAQQYLENVQYLNENQEKICEEMVQKTREKCETLEKSTKEECEALEKSTKENCEALKKSTKEKCEALEKSTKENCEALKKETAETCKNMLDEAQKGADQRWAEISEKLQRFYDAHQGLRQILAYVGEIPETNQKLESNQE